jgi:hypothetical protein
MTEVNAAIVPRIASVLAARSAQMWPRQTPMKQANIASPHASEHKLSRLSGRCAPA